MNLGGNIGGIGVPIVVGLIVQATGSYFLALMFFAAAGVGLLPVLDLRSTTAKSCRSDCFPSIRNHETGRSGISGGLPPKTESKIPMNRTLLGMLTPSSNTALEPLTNAMVADLPGVSAHFSRFPVTEISLRDQALGQFDDSKILEAARLLADARVKVIGWNGTSSGWLGFEADERLCRRIQDETGVPACTSVLALNEILTTTGATEFALVTPYLGDVQAKIVENYRRSGFNVVAERHLDLHVNFSFSEVGEDEIRRMVYEVAEAKPKAITTFCTNLKAAHLVRELEAEVGIPIYDTISTVVWKSLKLAGYDVRKVQGWGRLFQEMG